MQSLWSPCGPPRAVPTSADVLPSAVTMTLPPGQARWLPPCGPRPRVAAAPRTRRVHSSEVRRPRDHVGAACGARPGSEGTGSAQHWALAPEGPGLGQASGAACHSSPRPLSSCPGRLGSPRHVRPAGRVTRVLGLHTHVPQTRPPASIPTRSRAPWAWARCQVRCQGKGPHASECSLVQPHVLRLGHPDAVPAPVAPAGVPAAPGLGPVQLGPENPARRLAERAPPRAVWPQPVAGP